VAAIATQWPGARPAPIRFHWLTNVVLGILLVGPLVGPVFSALGWPLLAWINWPIYLMGENVCPQPIFRLEFLGAPMVVCSRCWAGVWGLAAVWLVYRGRGRGPMWRTWLAQPELLRVGLALALFAPWVLDIFAADQGWWFTGHPAMIALGFLGGLGAGQLVLPFATRARD
jgi:hypothetical protein